MQEVRHSQRLLLIPPHSDSSGRRLQSLPRLAVVTGKHEQLPPQEGKQN